MNKSSRKKMLVMSFFVFLLGITLVISIQNPNNINTLSKVNDIADQNELTAKGWSSLTQLTTDGTSQRPKSVVDSSGNVHVIWIVENDCLQYRYWDKQANTWQGKVNATDNITDSATSDGGKMVVDSQGNVHVIWKSDSSGYRYKFWNATSGSWNSTENVTIDMQVYGGEIALDNSGNIYVLWYNGSSPYNITYRILNSTTKSWDVISIIPLPGLSGSINPSMASSSTDNIHVAFQNGSGTPRNVYYTFWNATSGTWNTSIKLSTDGYDISNNPLLGVGPEGNVHVAWQNSSGLTGNYYYKMYDASSNIWSNLQVIAAVSVDYGSISVDNNGNAHFIYKKTVGANRAISYTYRDKLTGTWSTAMVISANNTGDRFYPTINADSSGNIHGVWRDDTPGAALHALASAGYIVYRTYTVPSSGSPTPPNPLDAILFVVLIIGVPSASIVALAFLYPRLKK